jgi:hypothetical protein
MTREEAMKRILLAALVLCAALAQGGCGEDHHDFFVSSPSATQILSDSAIDGDIAQTAPGVFTVTQGMSPTVQSVFAGIDPVSLVESRAFLDFPLVNVPTSAIIQSAFLDIVINSIQPTSGSVPLRIDLVSFPSTILVPADFSQAPLASIAVSPPITQANLNPLHVKIDVTALMAQAQLQVPPLTNFQLRIEEDVGGSPGFIEINDTTGVNRSQLAPLLSVSFF